jgi:alkanesulfonate monooxygenase SsuD/methylene tetrahydromethanopterin reductase-like flavin-dependent oxidoreductase (luciferase family)
MKFSLVLGQRLPFLEMLARAREAEMLGFDGLFLVDHFFGRLDLEEPTHEGYTMLAALAPFTSRLRLGLMVAGNTYRNPLFLLKQALTVDHISGGRVDFGVGAGWVEREHEAYGWEFPGPKERVDRFAEALEIWESLQTKTWTTFRGEHYTLVDAPCEPKSLQGKMPVLIGGTKPRMLRLTARYADIWNCTASADDGGEMNRKLDDACRAAGRDPKAVERSVSPDVNMLTSVEAFQAATDAYAAAGFDHITLPWPRIEAEAPVLREAARLVLGRTSIHLGSYSPAPRDRNLRAITEADKDTVLGIRNRFNGHAAGRALSVLTTSPDEMLDGNVIAERSGIGSHAEVTSALASVRDAFEAAGFSSPWLE